jgi:Uma2 family endonuclease
VQLVEGEIVAMPPQREPHIVSVGLAGDALAAAFGDGFHVRVQGPLGLAERSEPEPDLAVVPGQRRDYLAAHPSSAVLVVEVADSTLAYDRRQKASLYARHGIQEYWIVNLQERVLEVHRDPMRDPTAVYGASYRFREVILAEGQIAPLAAPNRQVKVTDLLP